VPTLQLAWFYAGQIDILHKKKNKKNKKHRGCQQKHMPAHTLTGNKLYRRAVMCNSQAICTIDSSLEDFFAPVIISAKNDNPDFENVPLLVNFAKWNNNEN